MEGGKGNEPHNVALTIVQQWHQIGVNGGGGGGSKEKKRRVRGGGERE